MFINSKGSNG